ncbi:hypothetical protein FHX82_005194 [Amycolatopsis bartoniae]|uniref:Uncharacterized protein n=1 Tax=Amycolatopsis bartoniae TaxID=941986 RepID=A0A8H9M894_9PSEU|nr:hypothetical protein [Amycolatopsis bartoniae]MBB2938118.1 hypothetical protein [Amycolatopsis bartoniae]TVT01265.1 hypothetical protein FNH07_29895 [Amycolatopsis bartoniae]GHF32791.1 hypothetical protein GCM10017566_01720 [Amycolatopsis bartoniae]
MNNATAQIRRIDQAIGAELVPLAERIDDGKLAIDRAARIACHLLGINLCGEVPYIDSTEVEATVLPGIVAVSERLRGPNGPARPQASARHD